MNRTGRMLCILTAFGLALGARTAMGEKLKLKLKWSQEFAKPVDWYVRTSAGIIVAKSGKSLVGIDEINGSLLWTLSDLDLDKPGLWRGSRYSSDGRAHDVMEIPGMGILLLNRVRLPGDKEGRLMAVNLETGKRLWDRKATDELMTAIPLYATGETISSNFPTTPLAFQTSPAGGEDGITGAVQRDGDALADTTTRAGD